MVRQYRRRAGRERALVAADMVRVRVRYEAQRPRAPAVEVQLGTADLQVVSPFEHVDECYVRADQRVLAKACKRLVRRAGSFAIAPKECLFAMRRTKKFLSWEPVHLMQDS
jgi:hypothetical protein